MTVDQGAQLLTAMADQIAATRSLYAAVCVLIGVCCALILAVTWKG